jgi:drug/metabolite transporter (DMT)-like permease
MVCFYLAIGYSTERQQVLEVAMINYLWPSFTLAFSGPILHKKVRGYLIIGLVVSTLGVFLALIQSGPFSLESFKENLRLNHLPYILAFIAALCWGLYSNLSRKWGGYDDIGAIPVFLLVTGLMLFAVKHFFIGNEASKWTSTVGLQFIYMVVFPSLLSYAFWDIGIRKGNHTLLASLSLYLRIAIGLNLWIASFLVVVGAIICKKSVLD